MEQVTVLSRGSEGTVGRSRLLECGTKMEDGNIKKLTHCMLSFEGQAYLIHPGRDLSRNFQLDFKGIKGFYAARNADGLCIVFSCFDMGFYDTY